MPGDPTTNGFNAVAKNILKSNQQRKLEIPPAGFLDDVSDVHRRAGILQRFRHHVPGIVDVEIFRAPALDIVQVARSRDIPAVVGVSRVTHCSA